MSGLQISIYSVAGATQYLHWYLSTLLECSYYSFGHLLQLLVFSVRGFFIKFLYTFC